MIRIDFSVPTEFVEVPIGIDFETAWAEVNERNARASLEAVPDQETLPAMAQTLHQISGLLAKEGVVYAANCLHLVDGKPALGSLAVAVMGFPYGDDAAIAVRGALRSVLDARGSGWSGSVIDAPCGMAAVVTGGQSYIVPAEFAPDHVEIKVPTAQFQAMIPIQRHLSDGTQGMCMVAFSTPNTDHWENVYAPMMATILRSLRFTSTAETASV
ncbi:hypothetical protein ACFVYR_25380 [Streptomyces sp. NPDC058284]|uniref:hypothetical protein n=1 Tax=unclassified Streptomyces TaxID=2593676 RepID=UPI003660E86C